MVVIVLIRLQNTPTYFLGNHWVGLQQDTPYISVNAMQYAVSDHEAWVRFHCCGPRPWRQVIPLEDLVFLDGNYVFTFHFDWSIRHEMSWLHLLEVALMVGGGSNPGSWAGTRGVRNQNTNCTILDKHGCQFGAATTTLKPFRKFTASNTSGLAKAQVKVIRLCPDALSMSAFQSSIQTVLVTDV